MFVHQQSSRDGLVNSLIFPFKRDVMSATKLRLNLNHLVQNYQLFIEAAKADGEGASSSEIAAVVKADAYGLGVGPVAQALDKAGCSTFFVAHGFEGKALRAYLSDAKIYVFHGCLRGEEELFKHNRLIPVLHSLEGVKRWGKFAESSSYGDCALQVDTGMNRLGVRADEFQALSADPSLSEGIKVHLIMSHLACADEQANPKNKEQLDLFTELMEERPDWLADASLSLANSAGTLLGRTFQFDVCRVGIGLYGGNPFSDQANPCRPVVSVETPILQLSDIKMGESVSYGATWTALNPSRIATIGVGYADGYLRLAGEGGVVAIGAYKAPIIGRVTMDLIMLDVTDIPEDQIQVGTMVELMGEQVTVDEIAEHARTIGYEVLTSLGQRYQRDYIFDH